MDGFNIGEQILNSVQDAVNSGDYSNLSRTIRNAVNGGGDASYWSVDMPGTKYTGTGKSAQKTADASHKTASQQKKPAGSSNANGNLPAPYMRNVPGSTSGLVMECIGFPLAGLSCLMMLGSAAVSVVAGLFGAAVAGTSVFGVMTLASFGVGLAGFVKRSRAKRYKQYVQKLTGKDYCAIDDLAAAVGRKRKYVLKDLQDMIDRRFFPEGRFDEKKTTFLGTNAMYQQYLLAQESMKQREEREARKKAEEEKIYSNPHMTEESRQLLKEGRSYIQHIRECNDASPGEEISAKLYRLEEIMTRIFNQVEKQPQLAADLRKFMNYYLPTTAKLVEAYKELDAQPVEGDNISRTKKEIEETLDTINEAFEKLLDSFFEEKAWDISSDISVMKSMLKQDGMTDRDFSTEK